MKIDDIKNVSHIKFLTAKNGLVYLKNGLVYFKLL